MSNPLARERERRDTPLVHVRSVFTRFLQGLFAEAPVGQYHWSEDRELTEIVIQGQNVIDAETVGQRPAITVGRGPIQMRSVGLGDVQAYDFQTAKTHKTVVIPGIVHINCCSRVDLESEHIAWVAMEHIWLLRHIIIKAGLLDAGRQPSMSPPAPAGSLVSSGNGEEWYCTPVHVPVQFPRNSTYTPLGNALAQRVEAHMAGSGGAVVGERGSQADGGTVSDDPAGRLDASPSRRGSGRLEEGPPSVPKKFPGDPNRTAPA